MSERIVHFENCVSTSDEQVTTGECATNEPFTESTVTTENHLSYNDSEKKLESAAGDKWRSVGRRIQSVMCIKNSVQPTRSRRKSIWRTPTETIDPFIQKFSTRSDNRKTTPPKRTSKFSHKVSIENNLQTITESYPPNDSDVLSDDIVTDCRSTFIPYSIRTVFSPEGLFIYSWSYFVVFAIRYNLWVLITRIAFPKAQSEFKNVWLVLDYLCDFIYFIDMVISFRTGYLDQGILVTEPGKIAESYIKSKRFFADILSLFPTDFFHVFYSVNLPLLRLNRLIKTYKSLGIKDIMESHTNYPTFYRVFFLLHLMFVLINWNAGIYIMISRAEGFGTNQWVYVGNGSLYQQYLKSFYWSTLTLTAIGDLPSPATNYEYIYTIACYLCGVFMFATIVGNAGNIIVNSNAGRMEFERQRESTKTYMQKNNVPKDLQRRVLMWYDYTWNRGRIGNSSYDLNTLTLLPDKLKTEIALHVNLETLSKVTFLQKCQPEFLHDLVLKMKLRIFTPGDYICRHGEVAREMYVIINGRIEVVSDTGEVLKVLSGGDFFGEIGILSLSEGQNKRTADIRTVGYVECFVLSKEDVLSATRDYPEAQAVLAEYGRRRLEGQTTCKDPRLVDMEDCKPVNSISPLPSINGSIPHLSSDSLTKPTYQLSKSIRTSRAGLLEPIDTPPTILPEKILENRKNIDTIPTIASTEDYDVIMKMMTSSCQDVISYVRELCKRKEELKKKETDVQLKALKEELLVKCQHIDEMTQLISAQEAELHAWREVVHELEDKRMEDTVRIEALIQDNQMLNSKLQRCRCSGREHGRTGLQLDTNDTLC